MRSSATSLLLFLLIGCYSLQAQTTKSEETIQAFFQAFNDTDSKRLDELTASPFIFSVDGKVTYHNSYSEGVDFDAIKKTGWRYSKILSSEVLYEDKYSSQVKITFSRFDKRDEVMSTNDVFYTLVPENSVWRIKSAIVGGELTLTKSGKTQ